MAFFADNFYTAFIPQLSGRLFLFFEFEVSMSVGAALPLSAKLFFIAMAAVAGGLLIDKFGMNTTLICGALTEIAGLRAYSRIKKYGIIEYGEKNDR